MKLTIYKCDTCQTIVSEGGKIAIPHFSFTLAYESGWVEMDGRWHSSGGIYQFCSPRCISEFFALQVPKRVERLGKEAKHGEE